MANTTSTKHKSSFRSQGLNALITISSLVATLGLWNLFSSGPRQAVSQYTNAPVQQPPPAAAPGYLRPVSAPHQSTGLRPVIQQLVDNLSSPFTPVTQTGSSR